MSYTPSEKRLMGNCVLQSLSCLTHSSNLTYVLLPQGRLGRAEPMLEWSRCFVHKVALLAIVPFMPIRRAIGILEVVKV